MPSSRGIPGIRRRSGLMNLFLAGILFLLILTACAAEASSSSEPMSSVQSSSMSSSSLSSETSSSSEASSEPESSSSSRELVIGEPEEIDPGISVETEHITFHYPKELEEDMIVRHREEEGNQIVSFSGEFSGGELELFAVVLGTAGENDFTLGVLKDDPAGEIPVSIRMNVQDPEDWSAEDFERINSLQERVNDIIIQFHEDPRFVPAQG